MTTEIERALSKPFDAPNIAPDDGAYIASLRRLIIDSHEMAERSRAVLARSFEAIGKLNKMAQPWTDSFATRDGDLTDAPD